MDFETKSSDVAGSAVSDSDAYRNFFQPQGNAVSNGSSQSFAIYSAYDRSAVTTYSDGSQIKSLGVNA